jgi:drug/metabolite transporter (DMT)-like permease
MKNLIMARDPSSCLVWTQDDAILRKSSHLKKFIFVKISKQYANLLLVCTGVIGALMPFASKIFLRELTPITALFFTLIPMALFFSPVVVKLIKREKKHIWKLAFFGFLWTGNITLFLFGIQYATSFISQIFYSLVPLYILFYERIIQKSELHIYQKIGIVFGIIGVFFLSYGSFNPKQGIGSFVGIILIFFATLCWTLYIIVSKRFSTKYRSMELTGISSWSALCIATLLVIFTKSNVSESVQSLSFQGWMALLFAAIIIRIVMIFFYNVGIKYGSTIAAAASSYIGPPVTFIIGWMWLGEKGNSLIYVGAILLCISVYLINTMQTVYTKQY